MVELSKKQPTEHKNVYRSSKLSTTRATDDGIPGHREPGVKLAPRQSAKQHLAERH
jgi:hypothetical protein